MEASVAPRCRLDRLPDDSDGLGAQDDSDASDGPALRRPARPPQNAPAAATSASLSVPLIVRPSSWTVLPLHDQRTSAVRVGDYLRLMDLPKVGGPSKVGRSRSCAMFDCGSGMGELARDFEASSCAGTRAAPSP